jgi:cell division transport system ATP-binding protein
MIRIENVTKRYADTTILNQLHFHLPTGAFAFLRGRSGSGKSTFLKLLYREIEADQGDIFIDDTNVQSIAKYELRQKIGIIFQSYELIEQKTVFENIALAGQVLGRPMDEIEQEAMRLLKRVGLAHKRDAFPNELSGGQQQRVAIVRALLNKPRLLLADEPTGNLDKETALEIMQLLYELHEEEQMTMLIVTHAEELLNDKKIYVMEAGRIDE